MSINFINIRIFIVGAATVITTSLFYENYLQKNIKIESALKRIFNDFLLYFFFTDTHFRTQTWTNQWVKQNRVNNNLSVNIIRASLINKDIQNQFCIYIYGDREILSLLLYKIFCVSKFMFFLCAWNVKWRQERTRREKTIKRASILILIEKKSENEREKTVTNWPCLIIILL